MRSVSKLEFFVLTVAVASTALAALLFKRLLARTGDQLTVSLAPEETSSAEGHPGKRRVEITIERAPKSPVTTG